MDLTAIFNALLSANEESAKSSPYRGISDAADSVGSLALKAAAQPKAKTKDAAIAGLISGTIGGLAGNLTRGYQEKQNALAGQVIADAIAGKQSTRPSGMSPSVFSTLQNAGSVFSLGRTLERSDKVADLTNQAEASLLQKGVRIGPNGEMQAVPGAAQAFQQLEGITPEVQDAIASVRMGRPLSEAQQRTIAAAPAEAQRLIQNVEYQNALNDRAQGVQSRFESGQEFKRTFDSSLNRKIFDKQAVADQFLTRKRNIDTALENFDPSETITGAIGRGIKANYLKDSDAADLQRQIKEAAFAALKPTFPGTLSDEERKEMLRVSGGDFGVPVGTIKKIFDRKERSILEDTNRDLKRALDAGYQVPFQPLQPTSQQEQQYNIVGPSDLGGESKIINGVTYRKTEGGWEAVE